MTGRRIRLFVSCSGRLPVLGPLTAKIVFGAQTRLPIKEPSILSGNSGFGVNSAVFLCRRARWWRVRDWGGRGVGYFYGPVYGYYC